MPQRVRSLSYNRTEGYIACGGDDGVLKAVKLDAKIGIFFSVTASMQRQNCLFVNGLSYQYIYIYTSLVFCQDYSIERI